MKRAGFTLVEGLIVVCIIMVASGVFLMGASSCGGNSSQAEHAAREWGKKMGLDVQGADCVDVDTDSAGYVSCSVSFKKADGSLSVKAVECASRFSWNSGCRMPKMTIPQVSESP